MSTTQLQPTRRRRPLTSIFDEMFEDFFAPLHASAPGRSFAPALDVCETADAFRLAFELPGMSEKDVSVQVDGDVLTVSGERHREEKTEGTEFHRVEHRYGAFARSVTLPQDVRGDEIEATFRNGVLTIVVPKAEPTRARKIEIKAE